MKFLTDQDVYALTVRFLRELGHDALTAAEAGLSTADDSALLARAVQEGRHFEHWNTRPLRLDHGGDGRGLASGTVFLLPGYPGLYHGFIEKLR